MLCSIKFSPSGQLPALLKALDTLLVASALEEASVPYAEITWHYVGLLAACQLHKLQMLYSHDFRIIFAATGCSMLLAPLGMALSSRIALA